MAETPKTPDLLGMDKTERKRILDALPTYDADTTAKRATQKPAPVDPKPES